MFQFLETKNIEAVHFELEELDRLLIAASAVIPVFRFKTWNYSNLTTVLIYPDYFDDDLQFDSKVEGRSIGGLVGTGRFENQMILSRKALHHGFSNKTDKGNTAIHEFIHLLDKEDGVIDGIPAALLDKQYTIPFLQLVHKKMEEINNDASDIRNYGGTSQIEFLAVAGEYFFERPKLLKRKHPELYKMLDACFIK
jgi:Mlc titration factor MtfA (ptsG expression regulator)